MRMARALSLSPGSAISLFIVHTSPVSGLNCTMCWERHRATALPHRGAAPATGALRTGGASDADRFRSSCHVWDSSRRSESVTNFRRGVLGDSWMVRSPNPAFPERDLFLGRG